MVEAKRGLSELVGWNLRQYREGMGWSQDHVARILRLHGLGWTRTMLAKVERGERPVGLDELLLLSIALGPEPAFFVGGGRDVWVGLSESVAVRPDALRAMLSAQRPRTRDLELERFTTPPPLDPAWPELTAVDLALAEASAAGEAERKAAERLDVEPLMVARAARVAWGVNLSDERDARVASQVPEDASSRTLQAVRGHVTRAMLDELRPVVAGRTRMQRKR